MPFYKKRGYTSENSKTPTIEKKEQLYEGE